MQESSKTEIDLKGSSQQGSSTASKVVIIGAGAAGIAAASRLHQNNITDYIILEAEDRIGGRIHTTQFQNFTVDLGAQFCHGKDGNIIYEMVKTLNLLEPETGTPLYTPYHSSRKTLDPKLFSTLFNKFEEFFYEEKDSATCSFGDYMIKRTSDFVQEAYGGDATMHKTAMEALNTYKIDLLANEGPFDWKDVAVSEDYEECDGDKLLGWTGHGFATILDILVNKYPDPHKELPVLNNVHCNHEVEQILWNKQQITVKCTSKTFTADHIIFTPSLGVLKEYHNTLFEPQLPHNKLAAIESIGIGSVIKIVYYFPTEWWPQNSRDFTFVWSDEDRQSVASECPKAVLSNGKSWLPDVLQLIRISNASNLLGSWICGECVPELEVVPEEHIIEGTSFLINKFLGHLFTNICKPEKILRTTWYANRHFKGAYSYQTIKSRGIPGPSQEVVLSEPIVSSDGVPRLLFAGEATSPTHYGTVHGAIETGWREADRIIQLYASKN